MKTLQIATSVETKKPFGLDLDRLIGTRMLVQASSGGGKSWLIRKVIEKAFGKVQIILLDVEGDFASLRTKFDFVIAGKGCDVEIDPRHADLLARKALDLNVNLICDLYEMQPPARIRFVTNFLNAMINAPKNLWHPVVVILDEAHLFAPEKGKAESLRAVADMASRGRKRGFCLIPATQRLAKLSKDVAAECQNKLIGLANLADDRKRAAEELGFSDKQDVLSLRDMEPGEFYAVGPAFERGVTKVQIGKVETDHPDSGSRTLITDVPKPTSGHLIAQLSKLADLPKAAEEELHTIESLQAKVRELDRQVRAKPKPEADTHEIMKAFQRGARDTKDRYEKVLKKNKIILGQFVDQTILAFNAVDKLKKLQLDMAENLHTLYQPETVETMVEEIVATHTHTSGWAVDMKAKQSPAPKTYPTGDTKLGACERKILVFLGVHPETFFTKTQVGVMTGYSAGSGGFNQAMANLSQQSLVIRENGMVKLADGVDPGAYAKPGDGPIDLKGWIEKLGKCERQIYELALDAPGSVLSKEEISASTGYKTGSGGFNQALANLSTLGLIKRERGGIRLNPEIQGL